MSTRSRLVIADDCVLASAAAGRRHLRSADTIKLLVRRARTVVGARDFACLAAAIWNSLPAALRLSSCSVQTFARKLKLFTPARRCCALQMHSSLLLLSDVVGAVVVGSCVQIPRQRTFLPMKQFIEARERLKRNEELVRSLCLLSSIIVTAFQLR